MRLPHDSKLNLNLLLAFHVVVTEGQISRAAERLGMTQSGLSHALARLREQFQDDLLVRCGGRMVATPRALELHEAVKELLDVMERRVLPVARFEPAHAGRQFTTAMSDMAEVVALTPLMAALNRQAPGCTLRNQRLPTTALTAALESGQVELALGNVFEPTANIYQQTLYTHDYRVLACADHPRMKRRLSLAQYQEEAHLVVTTGSDDHLRDTGLLPLGLQRREALVLGGLMSVPWVLVGTPLLATVPSHMARLVAGRLPLKSCPLPFSVPPFAVKTYWHPRSHSDAGHRWLRELIYEVLHTYPQWSMPHGRSAAVA